MKILNSVVVAILSTTVFYGSLYAAQDDRMAQMSEYDNYNESADWSVGANINVDSKYVMVNQKKEYEIGGYSRSGFIDVDANASLNAVVDIGGVSFGATYEVENPTQNVGGSLYTGAKNKHNAFFTTSSPDANTDIRVSIGRDDGVATRYQIGQSSIAAASISGSNGGSSDYLNLVGRDHISDSTNAKESFKTNMRMYTRSKAIYAPKASIEAAFAPQYGDFMVGASYTPDQGDGQTSSGLSSGKRDVDGNVMHDYENVVEFAGSYNVSLTPTSSMVVAASYEFGEDEAKGEKEKLSATALVKNYKQDLKSYSFGGVFTNRISEDDDSHVELAASYTNNGESGAYKLDSTGVNSISSKGKDNAFDAGIAFQQGGTRVSVGYIKSEHKEPSYSSVTPIRYTQDFSSIKFGASHKCANGAKAYVAYESFDSKSKSPTVATSKSHNKGSIFALGLEIKASA